ncbi:MAG: class I SAM-dependent methyltransferase [Nitrospirae bacterium]|nr:class I SAM-dependent methyltransferase [Nitrospirota bacterium]MBF0542452.1 class I SAM-dependent methyltransferase [Nitrospirota bacterium]
MWTGLKGKIGAWILNSPIRSIFTGKAKSAFLNVLSHHIKGDEVILDIGAGSGYFSLDIAEMLNTGHVICLDISNEMLNFLKNKAQKQGINDKIKIINSDASSIKLKDKSVNIVVSNFVLHEFTDPNIVFKEIFRVLKPNGFVIILDFLKDSKIAKKIDSRHHHGNAHGTFSVKEVEELYAKFELKNINVNVDKSWYISIGQKI